MAFLPFFIHGKVDFLERVKIGHTKQNEEDTGQVDAPVEVVIERAVVPTVEPLECGVVKPAKPKANGLRLAHWPSGFRLRVKNTHNGTNTSAMAREESSAVTIGNAKRIIKNRICPSTSSAGRKTMTVVNVAVVMANPISCTPLMQASLRDSPLR